MANEDLDKKIDLLICKVEVIESVLVGGIKESGEAGLVERIRKIEKWIDRREWFEKLVIVAIVGNTIGLIFALLAR